MPSPAIIRIYGANLDGVQTYVEAIRAMAGTPVIREKVSIASQKKKLGAVLVWLSALTPLAFGTLAVGGLWAISGLPMPSATPSATVPVGRDEPTDVSEVVRLSGSTENPVLVIDKAVGRQIGDLIAAVPRAPVVPNPPTNVTVQ